MATYSHNSQNTSTTLLTTLLAGFICAATPVQAQDVGLNVWGMEFATIDSEKVDHMAFYPGLSLSLTFETESWVLSPSLGAEWAADGNFWGIMAMLYADYPLNDHFGADLILAGMHDQAGDDWKNAEFFVGAGGGLSWFINKRVAFTPNVVAYYGLRTNTWALAPGVNLWVSLESQ
ncbi:MAG: hypothetical protein VYC39_16240 [Myxococcota bacterium]|nr:hypothetical protein [Myxococcota bacterium]